MDVAYKNVCYRTCIKDVLNEMKEDKETSSDWPDTAGRCNHNWCTHQVIAIVFIE